MIKKYILYNRAQIDDLHDIKNVVSIKYRSLHKDYLILAEDNENTKSMILDKLILTLISIKNGLYGYLSKKVYDYEIDMLLEYKSMIVRNDKIKTILND